MILEKVVNDVNSPLPFTLKEWIPFLVAYKNFFKNILEKYKDKLSNDEKKFVENQFLKDGKDINPKFFDDVTFKHKRLANMLALENRWKDIDAKNVEGKDTIMYDIIQKIDESDLNLLIPKGDGWNIEMDTKKLDSPKDISKHYKILLYLNSLGKKIKIDSRKQLRELENNLGTLIKDDSTIESIKEAIDKDEKIKSNIDSNIKIIEDEKEDSKKDGKNLEDSKKEEPKKDEEDKSDSQFKSGETFGSLTLPKGFFNNFANPNIEEIKIGGKTAIEIIKNDLLSKKDKITKLNNIKIYVCSNGLRNTALAEKLSFKELNDNRIENVKKAINKSIDEVKNDVKVDDINFDIINNWTVNTKLGDFKPNENRLVGPPTPYEKMVDINGDYFDYYKSLGKTLNTKTGLEGNSLVKLVMEKKGNSITNNKNLLPKNNYIIKDNLVSNAIFILGDSNIKIDANSIKTLLPKSEVILLDASFKEDSKKIEIADKIKNKTVLVNMSTIYGVSGGISKIYEVLNTLKIEWSYEKKQSSTEEKKEEKPKKEEKNESKKFEIEFDFEIINNCVVDCGLSIGG